MCELYIITNGISDVQHPRFDNSAIRPFIRGIFVSQDIGASKPGAAYFDAVMRSFPGVPHEQFLVVGDSLRSDIAGGVGYGLDTCWFNPAGKSSGDLSPTWTISRLPELVTIAAGQTAGDDRAV